MVFIPGKPEQRPLEARLVAAPAMAAPRPARISTERLMGGRREIVLQHGLEEYRLRITSSGKLILTK